MGMNANVFTWDYSARYYLKHPWEWIEDLFYNIRDAFRRAIYGWTYRDVWDLGYFLLDILPPMLRHMADKGSAYPGTEPFSTPEEWHKWLYNLADSLAKIGDEDYWTCQRNEYYEEWQALIEYQDNPHITTTFDYDTSKEHIKEINHLYWNRMRELNNERQKLTEDTFLEMAKHYFCLWD